jgi:predicted O-methyltransferase YrrM
LDYERIRTFVKSYIREDSDKLEEIYSSAVKREVPVIREDTRDYLRLLLNQLKPERILEIGTAVGYSALFMAEVMDGICDCRIDTIELDDVRADEAEKRFSELDRSDRIHLFRGDAAEVLKEISGEYDMIFIDAAKAQYMNYLNLVMHMVHEGSVIVTDNVLESGLVLESHFLVEKRDRTIHDKLREYLFTLKNDERLETAILSIGDGVAVSVVKKI